GVESRAAGPATDAGFRELGRSLARLHDYRGTQFGWHHDNFIGSTPQSNAMGASWAEFWRHQRLAPQLALAAQNGHRGRVQWLGGQGIEAPPGVPGGAEGPPGPLPRGPVGGDAAPPPTGRAGGVGPPGYHRRPEAALPPAQPCG